MKKKAKKIPKYSEGTEFYANPNFYSDTGEFVGQQFDNIERSKKEGVTVGGVTKGALVGAASGAGLGFMIGGPVGAAIGTAGGALVGGVTSAIGHQASADVNSNSLNSDDILTPESGISGLFHDDEDDRQQAYRVQNSNYAKLHTEQMRHNYAIKGINPNPNVFAAEGGVMDDYVMAAVSPGELEIDPVTLEYTEYPGDNGKPNSKDNIKKPIKAGKMIASNAAHMKMDNDKTPADNAKMILDSKMPEEMKRKMIKKVFNWLEANKTKPQEYAKYSEGNKKVSKSKLDEVMKKMGFKEPKFGTELPVTDDKMASMDLHRAALMSSRKSNNSKFDWNTLLSNVSDYAPLASALLGDYDYHKEEAIISPAKYIPVNADPRPLFKAADESYSIGNYNFANMGGSTGAYMAHSAQLASDRAKRYADAYKWQQDTQNKLIAQNTGIYNDWSKRYDAARYQAIADTRANEAAADYMKRTDIKSGLNWLQGRRRDRQLLPAYKQYLQYGMYDDILKGIEV